MTANKRSTLTQLSPAGEVFCDGFIANTRSLAAKITQDGAQVNFNATYADLTKSAAVIAEKNALDQPLRDALLLIGAHILVQAQKEAVSAEETKAKQVAAENTEKAAQ